LSACFDSVDAELTFFNLRTIAETEIVSIPPLNAKEFIMEFSDGRLQTDQTILFSVGPSF